MMHRLALLTILVGCGSSPETPVPVPAATTIAVEGQRFDPAVEKSEIPEGAWMCDMGTVHYAAGEKGEGKCPVCGMNLAQKQ